MSEEAKKILKTAGELIDQLQTSLENAKYANQGLRDEVDRQVSKVSVLKDRVRVLEDRVAKDSKIIQDARDILKVPTDKTLVGFLKDMKQDEPKLTLKSYTNNVMGTPTEYEPYNRESVPLGAEVRHIGSGHRHIIVSALKDAVFIGHGMNGIRIPYDTLLTDYKFTSGIPCGREVSK